MNRSLQRTIETSTRLTMKPGSISQLNCSSSVSCLVLTFFLAILVGSTAAQEVPGKNQGFNPLQVALLKWGPNVTTKFDAGLEPTAIAFDGINMWITNNLAGSVTKLRANDGAFQGTFPVSSGPNGVAFDGANVWVSNWASNTVSKISR